ncbi:hypothetical protein HID58_012475 [Brassica napus]|uniref:Uncharacterized protein n=1 Tax=Brassica napus TaxID=3708 RepID=A0ABQ8E1L2_BRANA|nr:hypothetical protein HID58_012475 [Brassica napus]
MKRKLWWTSPLTPKTFSCHGSSSLTLRYLTHCTRCLTLVRAAVCGYNSSLLFQTTYSVVLKDVTRLVFPQDINIVRVEIC